MRQKLLKTALESKKTTSRKAKSGNPSLDPSSIASSVASSRASSRVNSANNSRAPSRAGSRHPSEDSDDELSELDPWELTSIEVSSLGLGEEAPAEVWVSKLGESKDQLVDRKRSNVAQREEALKLYGYILTVRYARREIQSEQSELIPAILRSVKSPGSEKEAELALKALAVTMVTDPDDSMYEAVASQVKSIISDDENIRLKRIAIHTLAIIAFYGDVSVEETQDVMDFLLGIVESDGHSVDAGDDAGVVTAALEAWGFLASQLDDLEEVSETAMEALIEQLESSDPEVQIAAGENIALLFEKSFTPLEEDESAPSEDEDLEDERDPDATKYVKRYTVYRRQDQLSSTLERLAKLSSKKISRKARKNLHHSFADILNTVEHPTRGPKYQTAIDQETGKRYGSRLTVRNKTGNVQLTVDKWWTLFRLNELKRTLGGGFMVHYDNNQTVYDTLVDE
jgi:hypothetical protein